MAHILGCALPVTIEQKKHMLLENRVALWDVLASCDIVGSSDASITNAAPNDIGALLDRYPITAVFGNGSTTCKLYRRFIYPATGVDIIPLPSTSPANASFSLEKLCAVWQQEIGRILI